MDVTVTFPQELLIAAKETDAEFQFLVKLLTLGHLYQQGKISAGMAAQVLGCTRYDFHRLISEQGLPVMDADEADLAYEAQTNTKLRQQLQQRDAQAPS